MVDDEPEGAARQALLQQADADFDPLPFDADAAPVFDRVAASLRGVGRKIQALSYDAMTAAIRLPTGSRSYTRHLAAQCSESLPNGFKPPKSGSMGGSGI